jgi:PAS domain S-box-containing protein
MDESGKPDRMSSEQLRVLQDRVTELEAERRRLEAALRASQERFDSLQSIVNHSPAVVFLWRYEPGKWPVEYVSENIETLFGHSAADVRAGRVTLNDMTHVEDIPRLEAEVSAHLARGNKEWSQRYRVIAKSGEVRQVRDWNRLITDASGLPTHVQGIVADVTELRATEDALRRSEAESRRTAETLSALLHASPAPIIVLDADHRITLWSRAAERLYGWTEGEVLGKPSPLVPQDLQEKAHHVRKAVFDGESLSDVEGACLHKNGTRVPTLFYTAPLRDASGAVTQVLCICIDNTHRTALQQERERLIHQLQSERLRLSAVLQHMPAGAFIAEAPSGRIVMTNDEAARIWQVPFTPADSLAEYPPLAGYRPDGTQYEPQDWPLPRALQHGEVVRNEEIHIVRGDGTCAVILANAAPVRDAGGRITAAAVVFVDITERAAVRAKLRESEARFRNLVENLPGATYSSPLSNIGAALYVSPQIEQLTGYSPEEFMAAPDLWRSLYHPEDRERLAAESQRFQRHKRPTRFDYRIRRKDGTYIWVRDESTYVRDEKGKPICVQGIVFDNTAHRIAHEERRREQRLLMETQRIAQVGSWEMNFQTGELRWTPQTYRMFGVDARRTKPNLELAWRLVHPDDVPAVRKTLEEATAKRTPYSMVHRTVRMDGREIVVHAAGGISYDRAGKPLLLTGTVRDITEWHQAHKERHALSQLVENSSDMISMATLDGHITYLNKAGRRLIGVGRNEMEKGLTTVDISEPGAVHILQNTVMPTVMSQGHWEGEVFLRNRRTGKPVEGYGAVFMVRSGEDGRSDVIAAIIRDAREHRRIEREAMDAADREQQRIGMDLHDVVGQTLTGAAMLGTTLQRKLAAQALPEAEQAGRITRLILEATNQARELARGLCPITDGPEGLRAALAELARSTRELYAIDCTVRSSPDALVEDSTVAGQIYFIAREAVSNAVRHGQARTVRIHLRPADHGLELRVEDDGAGFSQDAHDKGGLGFRTMRYRAAVIGAQLSLEQNRAGGVTVRCLTPAHRLKSSRVRQEPKP